MKKTLGLGFLILTVAGCTPPEAITTPPAQYERQTGFNSNFHRGDVIMTVRARGIQADGNRGEVNASCRMSNDAFAVSFSTPSRVIVPNLGEATSDAVLECTHQSVTKQEVMRATNLTVQRIRAENEQSDSSGTLIGVIITEAVEANRENRALNERDPSRDEYGYTDTVIRLFEN